MLIVFPNLFYGQQCTECDHCLPNKLLNRNHIVAKTTAPNASNNESFFEGDVNFWESSFNTPHHLLIENGVCDFNFGTPQTQCMVANRNSDLFGYAEGIHTTAFTDLFIYNPYIHYCVEVTAKRLICGTNFPPDDQPTTIQIRAANGLENNGNSPGSSLPYPFVHGTSSQLISELSIPPNSTVTGKCLFIPNAAYSQLQLHPNIPVTNGKSASISIENVVLTCHTTALTGINYSTSELSGCGLTYNFAPILNHNGCTNDEIYIWTISGPDGVQTIGNTENINDHTFAQEGNYRVCLMYIDCNGCCAESCIDIEVKECCKCAIPQGFTQINATGGVNISTLFPNQTTFNNVSWVVCGRLIIDRDVLINGNSRLHMDSGAEIEVKSNARFRSVGNTYEACDKMWKGIRFESVKNLNIFNGNNIADAQYALNLRGGSQINVVNNFFNKNFMGIRATRLGSNSPSIITFAGNTFTCEDVNNMPTLLRDPYDGQLDYPDFPDAPFNPHKVSECGIFAQNVAFLDLKSDGLPPNQGAVINYFRNIRNGIIAQNTGLDLRDLVFSNLRGAINANGFTAGIGVLARVGGIFKMNDCQVLNAFKGVEIYNKDLVSIDIENNDFTNVKYFNTAPGNSQGLIGSAIEVTDCANNTSINVLYNDILNSATGITMINNIGYKNLDMLWNEITNTTTQRMNSGILINTLRGFGGLVGNEHAHIQHNTILGNHKVGIDAINSFTNSISYNTIVNNGNSETISMLGLYIRNAGANQVRNNYTSISNGTESRAYHTNASFGNLFCCNESEYSDIGFHFQGNCDRTRWRGNLMKDNTDLGLIYRGATVSPQIHAGNIWQGIGNKVLSILSDSPNNTITADVNDNPMNGSNLIPTIIDGPPQWFIDKDGETQLCDNECGEEIWFNPTCGTPDAAQMQNLERMAQGIVLQNGFGNQNLWSTYLDLFNYLSENLNLCQCSQILNNFISNPPAGIQAYHQMEVDFQNLFNLTNLENQDFSNAETTYNSLLANLLAIYSQVDESNYATFTDQIEDAISAMHVQRDIIDQIAMAINQRAVQNALYLKTLVPSLANVHSFNITDKNIWNIRLDEIIYGIDYVKANHLVQLKAIAESCPYEFGQSVHHAASLLMKIGENWDAESFDCANLTPRERARNVDQISISPNPSNGIFEIKMSDFDWKAIIVYDHIGRIVYKEANYNNSNKATINLVSNENGVYYFLVESINGEKIIEKVILIK